MNERRKVKRKAFSVFNSLWYTGNEDQDKFLRRKAYRYVANALGVDDRRIRFAEMDIDELRSVVLACQAAPRSPDGLLDTRACS